MPTSVVVVMRPPTDQERRVVANTHRFVKAKASATFLSVDGQRCTIGASGRACIEPPCLYGPFEHVFVPEETAEMIYVSQVADRVQQFLRKGVSSTVLTLGSHGGGKSHALASCCWCVSFVVQFGVLALATASIIRHTLSSDATLTISATEWISGEFRDLFAVDPWKPLRLGAIRSWKNKTDLVDLTEIDIGPETSEHDALEMIRQRRSVRRRKTHIEGSCGHLVVRFALRERASDLPVGWLSFVDTVGLQPVPDSIKGTERGEIIASNRVQAALHTVLCSTSGSSFRSHRLTRLLQDHLSCDVLVLGAVSACLLSERETRKSLALLQTFQPKRVKAEEEIGEEPLEEMEEEEEEDSLEEGEGLGSEWLVFSKLSRFVHG